MFSFPFSALLADSFWYVVSSAAPLCGPCHSSPEDGSQNSLASLWQVSIFLCMCHLCLDCSPSFFFFFINHWAKAIAQAGRTENPPPPTSLHSPSPPTPRFLFQEQPLRPISLTHVLSELCWENKCEPYQTWHVWSRGGCFLSKRVTLHRRPRVHGVFRPCEHQFLQMSPARLISCPVYTNLLARYDKHSRGH